MRPSQTSDDPVAELILRRHGVKDEVTEAKRGPRDPAKIDAIIRDIQEANRSERSA